MVELSKTYDPAAIEPAASQLWSDSRCFHAKPGKPHEQERFSIVIPPPNVTGALHLGHALNNTLQDILVRWNRMMGKNTLWVPGTDHAGIATQAVVERRIKEEEGLNRHQLGREKLVDRIWKWKDDYQARILRQLQMLGCSCDYDRVRFTLDEGCSRAVRETFFRLFKDGLILRGKRLVNWDCELHTAVADDEVYHETVHGKFYYFRYPLLPAGVSTTDALQSAAVGVPGKDYLLIATTRPETLLGDTAVAVHPDPQAAFDEAEQKLTDSILRSTPKDRPILEAKLSNLQELRAAQLPLLIQLRDLANAGGTVLLPLVNRKIPLVTDPWADPTKGTGCVKITPAHDPNDHEVGLRHQLPMINILNPNGSINENGGKYESMDRFEARQAVLQDLSELGLIDKEEDHEHEVGHSDRSKSPIEPYLSDQWFLKMDTDLTQRTLDAVRLGDVTFIPDRYRNAYLDWLGERRDWCISRQLWWGHRIPVWSNRFNPHDLRSLQKIDAMLTKIRAVPQSGVAVQISGLSMPTNLEGLLLSLKELPNTSPAETECSMVISLLDDDDELVSIIESAGFKRDNDVLDTWFSSALWPLSTLGWPPQSEPDAEKEPSLLDYYYPTDVLITSRDIITLWVVRMVLMGLYNKNTVPFRQVYIHPKILDGRGVTMSKSKGNGVDPLDIIEAYGADALRFGLAALTTETQDIRMPVEYRCPHCTQLTPQTEKNMFGKDGNPSKILACKNCKKEFATRWANPDIQQNTGLALMVSDKFESSRNFCNKLWNAARFALMTLDASRPRTITIASLPAEDRWILSRLSQTTRETHTALSSYQFSRATLGLRSYVWDDLCDWYLELVKYRIENNHKSDEARQILAFCLDQVLRLLHPIVPFITERLWQQLNETTPTRGLPGIAHLEGSSLLARACYPPAAGYPQLEDIAACETFTDLQQATREIRDVRNTAGLPPRAEVTVSIKTSPARAAHLRSEIHILKRMAGISALNVSDDLRRPTGSAIRLVGDLQIFVHDLVKDADERKRIDNDLRALDKRITGMKQKLGNSNYVNNAPPELVEETRQLVTTAEHEQSVLRNIQSLLAGTTGS